MGGDGAILILGTGSVGLIKRGEDSLSIGGYGFPISDEGSGAALGLSAIRHALRTLDGRSEEHTSELQSLMRISYAVFCLKKKKSNIPTNKTSHPTQPPESITGNPQTTKTADTTPLTPTYYKL